MNVERRKNTIEEQALDWLICLQDDNVTVEDISRWQTWLDQSPDHQQYFTRLQKRGQQAREADLSGLMPTAAELATDDFAGDMPVADYQALQSRTPESKIPESTAPTKSFDRLIPYLMAASIALAVGLWGLVQLTEQPAETGQQASFTTAQAEHRHEALFDGSEINIGAASKLDIYYSENRRHIILQTGEAYFKVAPNKTQPFVVSTPLGAVTAVGTAFNVRLADNRIMVTVTEGKVDVQPQIVLEKAAAPDKLQLQAGSAVTLLKQDTRIVVGKITAAAPLFWTDKRLVYRSEPLEYVVADLNRYGHTIKLMDDRAKRLLYSGVVTPDNIKDWLAGLPAVFSVAVRKTLSGRVIVRSTDSAENRTL